MWMYREERRSTEVHQAWTFTRDELAEWLAETGFSVQSGGWKLPLRHLAIQAIKL
jgi:hypothetical protein